jgi:hypothetical protein
MYDFSKSVFESTSTISFKIGKLIKAQGRKEGSGCFAQEFLGMNKDFMGFSCHLSRQIKILS